MSERSSDPNESAYVESQIIMSTVRIVAPFALTYGLFLMFHGSDSPGGSFQGGAIVGSTVLMIAFAFGIVSRSARLVLDPALWTGGTKADVYWVALGVWAPLKDWVGTIRKDLSPGSSCF